MRLVGLVPLVFVLAACGGTHESAAPTTTPSAGVTPDSDLAKAAEDLARTSVPSALLEPSELPPMPTIPALPTDAQLTITADPSKYDVKAPLDDKSDDCGHIWQPRNMLPSPYDGCMDGSTLVIAEGKQRPDGVYYRYGNLCAREGGLISDC
jgi:hypothetical protein